MPYKSYKDYLLNSPRLLIVMVGTMGLLTISFILSPSIIAGSIWGAAFLMSVIGSLIDYNKRKKYEDS